MRMIIASVVAGFALMLTSACATMASAPTTMPAKIVAPGQIFAQVAWPVEGDEALRAAGWGGRIEEVKAHVGEKTNWPQAMQDGDMRHVQAATIRTYRVEEVARFGYFDQDAVLLYVPAAKNTHMDNAWRLEADFFILIGAAGVAKG
ncbi:MAG: hypothetical protein ABL956_12070 [Hyphomonadaceae bacterium]